MQNSTIRMALRKPGWIAPIVLTIGLIAPALPLARAQREINVRPKADIVELPARPKRWALVVGVDKYESGLITPLIGASNDAKELADALINYAGFPREQVIVLSTAQPDALKQPKRNAIFSELDKLNGLVPADGLFLFAFSGHGVLDDNDNGYLLPADAASAERNTRLLQRTAVAVSDVQDEIRRMAVRQVIVLLDACRNNPVAGKGGGDNDASGKLSESFDFNRRNAEIEAFVTFYATQRKMRAYEDPVRRQGYFSYAFVEGLKGAAANERGEVTLARLIAYLEEKVPKYVRSQYKNALQVPRTVVDGFKTSDLVLAVTTPASRPPRTIDPCVKEDEAWERIRNSGNAAVVRAFLNEYPNCANARNARVLLAELESPASLPPAPRAEVKPSSPYRSVSFTTASLVGGGLRKTQAECEVYVEDLGGGITIDLARVRGGSFRMGSPLNEFPRGPGDEPQHEVRIGDFLMGRHEVTQQQWRAVAGFPKVRIDLKADPPRFKGDRLPVESISWDEAKEFIARLNRHLGLTEQMGYRLPSEAEWEYAARARTTTTFAFGATITPEIVNYDGNYPHGTTAKGNYREKTVEVGSLGVANAFGLFDMHGNVWEWCEDDWHDSYNGAPTDGRAWVDGASRGSSRVLRGGGWNSFAVLCRSASRNTVPPDNFYEAFGFRLLKTYR